MKIIVVDDEKLINQYIVQCIRDADSGVEIVGAVTSGAKALQLLEQATADVVFADITMPKMDGIELLRAIKAKHPSVDVVMLTCHDEFTYARTAMQYQASDYILKNELSPELVRSEIEKLRKKRHQRVALHEVRRASRNEFLKKLIGQENEGGALRIRPEELRTNQIELENRAFAAAIFMSDAKNYQTIQRAMYGHFENPIFCAYSNCTYMLANLPYGCRQDQEKEHLEAFCACREELRGALGCSRAFHHLERLQSAILYAIRDRNATFYQQPLEEFVLSERRAESVEQFIMRAAVKIEDGEIQDGCREIEKLLAYAAAERPRVSFLVEPLGQLVQALGHKVGFDFQKEGEQIVDAHSFPEVLEKTDRVIRQAMRATRRYSDPIQRALGYINEHFSEDISLNTVADVVYLNRDYLSRQFKKEVGVNFSEYLMNYRMERAKRLLEQSSLRISDVALQVGISNMSYFSTVFHKVFGCSPNEMRKNAGRR